VSRVLVVVAVGALLACAPDPGGQPCDDGAACPGVYQCVSGTCRLGAPCASDDQCTAPQVCRLGRCERSNMPWDAGPTAPADAGVVDAAGDAGAGGDAGLAFDGGALDGAIPDAGGGRDGGAADGGAGDAGFDAGALGCGGEAGCPALFGFTPRLAQRLSAGPFDVGVALQGDARHPEAQTGDRLRVPAGDVVAGRFRAHADPRQGTVVAWVVPERAPALAPAGELLLFDASGLVVTIEPAAARARVRLPDDSTHVVEGALTGWSAGAPRLFVLRWDARRALFGGSHAALTVDGTTTTFGASAWQPPDVSEHALGAFADGSGALNGQVAGLTVYRRPLRGASFGVDTGRGDELAAIAATGGVDPTRVTGPWDVVFALPTAQRPGELAAERQAWSTPHASNRVAGFDLVTSIGGSWQRNAWARTAPLSSEDDAVFAGGVLLDADSSGGAPALTTTFPLPTSGSVVARVLLHSVSGGDARVSLGCAAQAPSTSLEGTSSSDALAPDELLLTWQAPAGADAGAPCAQGELQVRAPEDGALALHQVEVYDNLVDNPSFEAWGASLPAGWQKDAASIDDAVFAADTTSARTGAAALSIDGEPGAAVARVTQALPGLSDGAFYAVGGAFAWRSGQAPAISVDDGALFAQAVRATTGLDTRLFAAGDVVGGWQRLAAVGRRELDASLGAYDDLVRWGAGAPSAAGDLLVDDAWAIALAPVALVPAPASLARSTNGDQVRLDGDDGALQRLTGLDPGSHALQLNLQLGRPAGEPLGTCAAAFTLVRLELDGGDVIELREDPGGLALWVDLDGEEALTTLSGVSAPLGSPQDVRLSWSDGAVSASVGSTQLQVQTSADDVGAGAGDLWLADGRCDRLIRLPGARSVTPGG
jgi:hypothetical protein